MNKRFGLWLLAAVSIALGGAGAVAAMGELQAFAQGGQTSASRFEALRTSSYHYAASPLSRRTLLDICGQTMDSFYARTQDEAARAAVFSTCQRAADAVTAENPTDSYAWYVAALATRFLGDMDGFNLRLRQSQLTGPAEQWMAEKRVQLAEDNYTALSDEVRAGNDDDLVMLVHSWRGARSIAARYVGVPDFRERITQIVETLPDPEQRRFLAAIRNQARQ